MPEAAGKSPAKVLTIHHVITIALFLAAWLVPGMGQVSKIGMNMVITFVALIYGWSTIGMTWPSLIGIISLCLSRGMDGVLAGGFGGAYVWMTIAMLTFIGVLNENGTTNVLATFFITRKFSQGKPWVFLLIFFYGCYFCCILNNIGCMIMFWTITINICQLLGIAPKSKLPTMMFLGILSFTCYASIALPFGGISIIILGAMASATGLTVDFFQYTLAALPLGLTYVLVYVFVMRFILRVDVSPLKNFRMEDLGVEKVTMNRDQKISLGILVWMFANLFAPNILPEGILLDFFAKLGLFGQCFLPLAVFALVRTASGLPFINLEKMAQKYTPWNMVFMMGVLFPMVSYLTADDTGVKEFLGNMLIPLSNLGNTMFIIILLLVGGILTNLGNNIVMGSILLPVVVSYAMAFGGLNIPAIAVLIIFACNFSIALPSGGPWCAMMFAYDDWLKFGDVVKYASVVIVFYYLWLISFGNMWVSLVCSM